MVDELTKLPWDELQQMEAGIPWPALRTIAEAAPASPDVVLRLFDTYEQTRKRLFTESSATDLCVTAIFALAAPHFDDTQKRRIGRFLIEKLIEAGAEDDDLIADTLVAACGAMGPAVLPLVLDLLESERDIGDAWFWLWDLAVLATETEDEALRRRTIGICTDLLEKADRSEIDPGDAMPAGWTLARLRCTEHADLLERVRAKADNVTQNSYQHILDVLHERSDDVPEDIWQCPVEDWLEWRWKKAVDLPVEEEPEADPDRVRARAIASRFAVSPAARALPPEMRDRTEYIVRRLVHSSLKDLDLDVYEWDEPALRELLVEILPANMVPNRALLTMIAPVTEAFLSFLGEQRLLPDADGLARAVRGWGEQIVTRGLDPAHWSPVTRTVMGAISAGVDVFDPKIRKSLAALQTEELLETLASLTERHPPAPGGPEPGPTPQGPTEEETEGSPLPITEHVPKTGRNAPCPCGSGRKYKKCCGRSSPQVESGA